jgi:hypothetical protein
MKMNKLTSIGLVSAFVLSASAASAATIVFGGANSWSTQGVSDNANSNEIATITDNGFTFNLGINFSNGNVGLGNTGELTEEGRTTWRNNGSEFTFTIAVVDNNAGFDLDSLSVASIGFLGLNKSGEAVTITETASANSAVMPIAGNPNIVDSTFLYTTNSLTQMNIADLGAWDMILENTGDNQINGIHSLTLDYTTSAVPEPGTYALLAGCAALGFVMLRRRK